MASLLVLSEASSSFLTCFTRLTHPSTVPALAHPQVGVSTVRSSSVAFLSFHFPFFFLAFPLLRVLSLRLLSPVLTFHELQAAFLSHHTGPPTAPLLPRAAAVSPFTPPPPSVRISPSFQARFHSWSPTLSRNWSPGYVTRTKSAVRAAPLCLAVFSPGYLLLWSHRSLGFLPRCQPVGP